jgi:hypothetical protein
MRHSSCLLAAAVLAGAASTSAWADEASLLARARALVAKTLPQSEVQKIVEGKEEQDEVKVGDWAFAIENDDPGIMRTALTPERGKGVPQLMMEAQAESRCGSDRLSRAFFVLGSDERLPLKGTIEKGQYTEAWVSFADGAAFVSKPTKLRLDFSQNDGSLSPPVGTDATFFAHHDAVAFCATAGKPDARCLTFSLKGFARAYEFVCQAK